MIRVKEFIKSINWAIFSVIALLFIFYSIALPHTGHDWDTTCWREWTKHIFQNGLSNTYKIWTDYLPLYHYILYIFGKIQGSIERIDQNIYYLKVFTLVFDFIAGCIIYHLLKRKYADKNKALIISLFFFLNIAYFYNTIIWGQVDGIMACLVLLSFYFAVKQNTSWALVFVVLSINFKLQSIIFIPLIGLMLLPAIIENYSLKNIFRWILIPGIVQLLILLPFIISGDLSRIWSVVTGSMGKYPVISMNAYNFWVFFYPKGFMTTSDTLTFLGLTLKFWGLILFFVFSFFALLPLVIDLYNMLLKKKISALRQRELLLIAALIPLIFFFFNTQMHERYVHPAILFLALYTVLYERYLPYAIGSLAYFLNLEDVLQFLHIHNYSTIPFTSWVIAIIFLITMVLLFYDLYLGKKKDYPSYI